MLSTLGAAVWTKSVSGLNKDGDLLKASEKVEEKKQKSKKNMRCINLSEGVIWVRV